MRAGKSSHHHRFHDWPVGSEISFRRTEDAARTKRSKKGGNHDGHVVEDRMKEALEGIRASMVEMSRPEPGRSPAKRQAGFCWEPVNAGRLHHSAQGGTDGDSESGLRSASNRRRFLPTAAVLNDSERTLLKRVREFTEGVVAPVIEDYWSRDALPFEIIPKMAEVGIGAIRDTAPPAAVGC